MSKAKRRRQAVMRAAFVASWTGSDVSPPVEVAEAEQSPPVEPTEPSEAVDPK